MTEVAQSYNYCPRCSAPRSQFEPARPFRCDQCGHTSFFGPVTAVGGVITNEHGQILLLERARDPGKGMLGMPGGFVDAYETAESALAREVEEEVGIRIENVDFLMTAPNRYTYQGVVYPVLDIFFSASVSAGQTIQAESSEVSNWHWQNLIAADGTPGKLARELLARMAFESNRLALEFYFDKLDQSRN